MWLWASLWKLWEYKQMFSKYKSLQKALENLIIRAKEWKYIDANWEEQSGSVVIDITGEMKVRAVTINDESLLSPAKKTELENLLLATMAKAQTKAQEVVQEKTKEILWMDPNDLAGMLWGLGK